MPVVLLDVLKGFVPALLGMLFVSPHHLSGIVAGAAAMLGHWRPLFLRFAKGGKMVATCGGVFFGVAVWVALTAGLVWLAVFLTFRYASLASIVAGIALPVCAYIYGYPTSVVVFGVAAAAAILFLHRANLGRLRSGTENRFHFRRAAQCVRRSSSASFAAALWLAPGALAAGWCGGGDETGTDRPDVVTAQQVHAVVAIPSDAADPFATDAGRLADDVTSMLTWWQGQDPTRDPALRPGRRSAAATASTSASSGCPRPAPRTRRSARTATFSAIASRPRSAPAAGTRTTSSTTTGPRCETNVCGVGGTEAFNTGPGFAIVLLQGCPTVPSDTIATHELLHALGAVPPGDPHACPGDSRPSVRLADRRALSVRVGRPALVARARLQPRRLLRPLRARGPTSRIRSGCTGSTCRR